MKLQEFDTHNYLLFQPVDRCFKNNSNHISAGKSKGLSDESKVKNHTNIIILKKFDGNCLKQEKVTFTHEKVVSI